MRRIKRRNRWQKIFYSPPVLLLCLLLIILLVRSVWQINTKREFVTSEAEALQAQLKRLEERKKTLEANLQFLASPRSVEAEIRSKFFVAKEGEKVIAVVPQQEIMSGLATSSSPWLKRWEEFWDKLGV